MSVAERIARRREELGLTQTELAKKAGLKPPAISQYESGVRSPSYEALIKLTNALDVTTDFLISGSEIKSDIINEKTAKILINIIQEMSVEKKEMLLQYASFLTNMHMVDFGIPILNNYAEYADYIFKNFSDGSLPVNVFDVASKLGISIYKDNLGELSEGTLIKNSGKSYIILDDGITNQERIKFTVAILIGHAIIPWHIKSSYIRNKGTSTLHNSDRHSIEAQKFAASLIMPQTLFLKDLTKEGFRIKRAKEISKQKYGVSLTSFLNKMVDYQGDKYSVVFSNNEEVKKSFSGKRPLVEKVNKNSIAYSFFKNPPEQEEIRGAEVPASYWFSDAEEDEVVYEESICNPVYGDAVTLITIK